LSLSWIDWDIDNVTVILLTGRLTLGQGTVRLREALQSALDRDRRKIVLDMGEVIYIDSSGLGELVSWHQQIRSTGGDLKLIKLQGLAKDLIQITRLYMVFDVFADEASAVESFRAAATE